MKDSTVGCPMIQVTPQMRILLAAEPEAFRKGIDGLAGICRKILQSDPFSGYLFIFINRGRTAMKILCYDSQGFWLCQKRLSKGRFNWWPKKATGIISRIGDDRQIALFYTGPNHAGENINELYRKKAAGRLALIQMCDALSRNISEEFKAILSNCLTHARRNFVDEVENIPEETAHVIEVLAEVYGIDAQAKKQKMTPGQRLVYHKKHSGPLMTGLKFWLSRQTEEKLVEPNSGLGKAITYMNNHWTELTRFLEIPGAPLDNNICERSLKRCIQHRKNSLFYRTENGAFISIYLHERDGAVENAMDALSGRFTQKEPEKIQKNAKATPETKKGLSDILKTLDMVLVGTA
ncbi:MAG: IS66 family insertion sequence element accessory protein TnpB [Proteobacteria bacterium]|nr:IS66 family insertion sequence element accessory protein TnpB [Pseudomonadota bacterium]